VARTTRVLQRVAVADRVEDRVDARARPERIHRRAVVAEERLVAEVVTEERAELVDEEEIALDVRPADVDRQVREHAPQPIRCERLQARQDHGTARDADHLGQRLDGMHQMLEHLGRDDDVEGAVAKEAG
jgi:hypothetical protein